MSKCSNSKTSQDLNRRVFNPETRNPHISTHFSFQTSPIPPRTVFFDHSQQGIVIHVQASEAQGVSLHVALRVQDLPELHIPSRHLRRRIQVQTGRYVNQRSVMVAKDTCFSGWYSCWIRRSSHEWSAVTWWEMVGINLCTSCGRVCLIFVGYHGLKDEVGTYLVWWFLWL